MSLQAAQKSDSIQDFVNQLRDFPASAFDHTADIVGVLASTAVNPDSLAPYLNWDRQHYTRNLIDKTPLYELMAICWEVGPGEFGPQSPRPELLDGGPHRPPAGGKLPRRLSDRSKKASCELETADTVEMNPTPSLRGRSAGTRAPRAATRASSTSARSACTYIRVPSIPAWSTLPSRERAEKSNCTTRPSSAKPGRKA